MTQAPFHRTQERQQDLSAGIGTDIKVLEGVNIAVGEDDVVALARARRVPANPLV